MSQRGFDFFDKPKEIKKKAKVKCAWCEKEVVNLTIHLKTCKKYKEEQAIKEDKSNFKEKIQKQIGDLVKKNDELTKMILKSRESIITEEKPVITALLNDIKSRNIDDITEDLMKITGLNEYDYYVNSNHFCANMKNIKSVIDPKKEPEKYKLSRFINRIYKGDRAMYRTLVKYLNERDKKIIDKYSN
jgi:hypothetical protein